jgi:hypothetical protein
MSFKLISRGSIPRRPDKKINYFKELKKIVEIRGVKNENNIGEDKKKNN